MKTQFDLKTWLGENRETIISKYNDLATENFFNGITLKDFMMQILAAMQMNNIKSAKRASSMLPFLMGNVYHNNSKVVAEDKVTSELKLKYEGTAYMSLV